MSEPEIVRTEETVKDDFEYIMTVYLRDMLKTEPVDMQARGDALKDEVLQIQQEFGIMAIPSLIVTEISSYTIDTLTYNWVTCTLSDAESCWEDLTSYL